MPELTQALLAKVPYRKGNSVNPKYVFVGIGPGKDEFADPEKRAFVGFSGKLMDEKLIRANNIPLEQCYFTNVIKERVAADKWDVWIRFNTKAYETYLALLKLELELVAKQATVLVPLGDIPLRAVCGRKGITNWRGSIIPSSIIPDKKCVPSLHPAHVLRDFTSLPYVKLDFARIKEESATATISLPKRTYIIRPTFEIALQYLRKYFESKESIAVDLETFTTRPNRIVSIQFADSPDLGFCLPFQYRNGKSYWTVDQELILLRLIYQILTTKRLVGQNFVRFDTFMLHFYGIPYHKILPQVDLDTLEAFACYQPELPHSLQFLTSVYTREPFYKEEGKEWSTKEGEDEFWTYGCKDSCVTKEVAPQIKRDLIDNGLWDSYVRFYRNLEDRRMRLSTRGVAIDMVERDKLNIEFTKDILKTQCNLTVLAGTNINVNSPKQMQHLLYDTMKLPRQYKDDKVTTDENALLTLSTKSDSKIFPLIISQRSLRKLKSSNIDCKLDSDNRFRTSYGFTETGRFTSSQVPLVTGGNLQNWQKRMRSMVIPYTKGYVLCKGDLSQAEARVVAWAGNMRKTIELFLNPQRDIHRETAALMFNKALERITAEERYSAKRIRYGVNYGMAAAKFAKTYNKEAADVNMPLITAARAQELITRFHEIEPDLRNTYHRIIQESLKRNKQLTNPFGRKMQFHGWIGDDLFRSGYSWFAQSTVTDLINTIWERVDNDIMVILQNHDELAWLSEKDNVDRDCRMVWNASKIELDVCPDKTVPKLIIPLDIEVGDNWYKMTRWEGYKNEEAA